MLVSILSGFRLLFLLFSGPSAVAIENIALRQQLAIYKRTRKRPQLTRANRWFCIVLSQFWKKWRDVLVIVERDTVVRWHRRRFRGASAVQCC